MKRTIVLLVVMALVGLSGCATKKYVGTQVDPLAERVGKLEAAAEASSMDDASQAAAIKQADDKAQLALDTANKATEEARSALQNAQKAEAAAANADIAAREAALAAENAKQMTKKSEKIFELQQKK